MAVTGASYAARLVAHAPNGARLGLLPQPLSWSASVPRNDVGALSLTYSRKSARGVLLQRALHEGLEVAVEVAVLDESTGPQFATWDSPAFHWDDPALAWDGLILDVPAAGVWVEPQGCRFVAVKRGWSVDDRTDTVTLTAPGYGWMLSKIRSLNVSALLPDDHTERGKRPFLSANAGLILSTLLGEYEARHSVTVARDFTTAKDSAGVAWASVATLYYEHGIPVDVVWQNLVASGMVDVAWSGRLFRVLNPSAGAETGIKLHMGVDIAEAPSEETIEDLVSHMTLHGGGGLDVTESDPTAPTPWGPWEGFASNESVTTEGTARALIQAELERSGRVRGQYTRDLLATSRHRPFLDFAPGDWLTAPTTTATGERVRVEAITLRQEAGSPLVAGLTLHDRFLDAEVKRARRTRGIVGGSTVAGGSTVRPDGPDRRAPAAPLGLVVATSIYLDADGAARGLLSASWDPVTTARSSDGGGALEVAGYDLAVGPNVIGAPWPVVRTVTDTDADLDGLNPGDELRVRVRAKGKYATAPGDWSDPVVVTVVADTTPPPTPSDPVAASARGVGFFKWDGKTSLGTDMPRDFSMVFVEWEGTSFTGAPATGTTTLDAVGTAFATALLPGTTVRARFQAADRSGNRSGFTGWASVTVSSVLDGVADVGSITEVLIDENAVTAPKLLANQAFVTKLTAAIGEFDGINTGWLRASALEATLVLLTELIGGDPTGTHVKLDPNGLTFAVDDPTDGVPNVIIRMGTSGDDVVGVADANGNTIASISSTGEGSFQKVYSRLDPEIVGIPLLGAFAGFASPTEQQATNYGILDNLPRGVVAFGHWGGGATFSAGGSRGIAELAFRAEPGRTYKVSFSGALVSFSAATSGGFFVRLVNPSWTVGGTAEAPTPTLSNGALLFYSYGRPPSTGNFTIPSRTATLRCNPGGTGVGGEVNAGIVKLLLCESTAATNITTNAGEALSLTVEDIGPDIPNMQKQNNSTTAAPQPSQPTSQTFTKTYTSIGYATYRGDGVKTADSDVVQGYTSYAPQNGDRRGIWLFPPMTGDLAGATIKKIEVYAYANHWHYNAGGTARIKVHGYASAPAASPSLTTAVDSAGWPKPGGRWVTLPSGLHAGFVSGSYRGFGMGPAGSTSATYYGRFQGAGAQIRVTYVK